MIILASTLKVPKIWRPKLLKSGGFDHHAVVWGSFAREPPRISARTLYRLKVESLVYILLLIVWVYLLSNFRCELRQTHHLQSKVRYGPSRSSEVVDFGRNRKGIWDFLLVINTITLVLSLTVFEIRRFIRWKSQIFCQSDLFGISRKALRTLKVGVFCGADSENFAILAFVALIGQQDVTDRRTDGRLCHS